MQNLYTFEAMAAVTLQFMQQNAQYQAGVTVTPNRRKGPDDLEIDALTRKGKGCKGKGNRAKSKDRSCFVCGHVGHMAKDCWFKETSKGSGPNNNKGEKDKGKGKSSVHEIATPTESVTTSSVGPSTSQISRATQDTNTLDRPVTMDEDEDEEYEIGFFFAAMRQREPFRHSKRLYVAHVLVDNCADEHVCSP